MSVKKVSPFKIINSIIAVVLMLGIGQLSPIGGGYSVGYADSWDFCWGYLGLVHGRSDLAKHSGFADLGWNNRIHDYSTGDFVDFYQ